MIPYNANIVSSFPSSTIGLIISLLSYETLKSIHLKINQNTASVDSNLGDGIIRLLLLTVSAAVYNTLLTISFVIPKNPGTQATGTGNSTHISAGVWVHTENTRMLRE